MLIVGKTSMDRQHYLYYHLSNIAHQNVRKKRRPTQRYNMPNSTAPYPPNYSDFNIINSSVTPPNAAEIYSGVEPLPSLDGYGLAQHFNHTSVPETSAMIADRTGLHTRRLVNQYDSILNSMNKPVEYFNHQYAPRRT